MDFGKPVSAPVRLETSDAKPMLGEDYYLDEFGRMVFTVAYHLKRGHCCDSGCRHCPYPKRESSMEKKELHPADGRSRAGNPAAQQRRPTKRS